MSMKDLAMYHAIALMYQATYGKYVTPYTGPIPTSLRLPPEPPVKLTGFTQVKGRRHLTKKQRKHLKAKKQ